MQNNGQHPILDRHAHLRAAADDAGFECLDSNWRGLSATYRFRCREGHLFQRTLQTFGNARETKCPECVAEANLGRLSERGLECGVRCLEPRWLGWNTPHRFQCEAGHAWSRSGQKALNHVGCAACGREAGYQRKRNNVLERLHQLAAARGGCCLSTTSAAGQRIFRFRCSEGHEWDAAGSDVLRRTWCPSCARLRKVQGYRHKDGLERLRRKAAEHGGQCLSDTYGGVEEFHRFRCAHGHEWSTTGGKILLGNWCGACANDRKRLGIEAAQAAAIERGGQCLSTVYRNTSTKLRWLCHRGHEWHAGLASIRAGHWCPQCAHMARIINAGSLAWMRYRVAGRGFAEDALDLRKPRKHLPQAE
ncbi:hypothetical protein ACFWP0_05315 [Achromobacter sp. NPDC058515]|uniref:hypothetical protein n=1 Tax=Achromobacter sp. NPDC058515 TaxID=3346533 RepID=UPI00365CB493